MGILPIQAVGKTPGREPKWLGGWDKSASGSHNCHPRPGHTGGQLASMGKNLVPGRAKGV